MGECVVVARPDASEENRLTALVVALEERPGLADDLRKYLRRNLPEYMVPAAIIFLKALPRTANGKVNRRELPAHDSTQACFEQGYVEPVTPVQRALAEIWRNVLGRDRVGVNDNFFELGGHSLMAAKALARIRQTFHIELPMRAFFDRPTIASAGAAIEEMLIAEIENLSDEEARSFTDKLSPVAKVLVTA